MFGTIRNPSGEVLDYTFHAGTAGSRHIAVLGHGVTGNKDRPFVVALAEGLAAAGIHALRFSFAGNGASEGRFAGTGDGGSLKKSKISVRCSAPWTATRSAMSATAWGERSAS